MKILKHIPNFITSLNLLSGCIAITLAAQTEFVLAAYFIFAAAIFDFLDGFAARLLKASSSIGLQLDSMADMVSFGLAPAIMLFYYLNINPPCIYLPYIAFLIAIFSALRLAKFNIDTRQTESFIGFPTPANAIFISSTLWYAQTNACSLPTYGILVSIIILSFLLVSELPMFSLKIKKTPQFFQTFFKNYPQQIILIISGIVFCFIFGFGGLSLSIVLYVLLALLGIVFKKNIPQQ